MRDAVDVDTNKKFAVFRKDRPRPPRDDNPPREDPPPPRAPLGPLAGPSLSKPAQEEEEGTKNLCKFAVVWITNRPKIAVFKVAPP